MPQRLLNLGRMLRAERRPRPALERLQLELVQALLRHAFERVPAYRELWRAHGVSPRDVTSLADFERIPIVDKSMMRGMGVEGFIDERLDRRRLLPRQTSGSSGQPFQFFVDETYDKWRKAQRLRPYVTNGVALRNRMAVLTFDERPRKGIRHRLGILPELRVSAARPPHEILEFITDNEPRAIAGYPSVLALLADECISSGTKLERPILVFSDSEVLTPSVRDRVTQAFGTEPIDVYGTFESDNTAFQCSERNGLHVAMESVLVEVVADGRRVPDGEQGEIVVTVLRNRAMPFIRYNLHDLGAYSTAHCTCGRSLRTLEPVKGREDDYIRLGHGDRRPVNPLMVELSELHEEVREFRLVQAAIGEFVFHVWPGRRFAGDSAQRIGEIIARHVPGARTTIVECPAGIPRDLSGKLRAFVSAADD